MILVSMIVNRRPDGNDYFLYEIDGVKAQSTVRRLFRFAMVGVSLKYTLYTCHLILLDFHNGTIIILLILLFLGASLIWESVNQGP